MTALGVRIFVLSRFWAQQQLGAAPQQQLPGGNGIRVGMPEGLSGYISAHMET